jgi:hypothetical protein
MTDCGCKVEDGRIVFCALHGAAAEMRDLLQLHEDIFTLPAREFLQKYQDTIGARELMERRRALLAKVNR